MAIIGQALTAPETGWQRFEENNVNISYIGTWSTDTSSNYSGTYTKYSNTNNSIIKFNFIGNKLRIIGRKWTTIYSTNIIVRIDGIEIGSYSQINGSVIYQSLDFEVLNLLNKEHYVEIENTINGSYIIIDAIDIDENGELKLYNENPAITKYLIKDKTNNLLSLESGGGEYTENLIPAMTSSTLPSGKASASSTYSAYYPFEAFDNVTTNGWCANTNSNEWVQYKFSNKTKFNKYIIYNVFSNTAALTWCPKSWVLKGSNDGTNWDILDNQNNQIWTKDEGKEFIIYNNNSYLYYKFDELNCNGDRVFIGEIEMMEKLANVVINLGQSSITEDLYKSKGFDDITLIDNEFNETKVFGEIGTINNGKLFKTEIPTNIENIEDILIN